MDAIAALYGSDSSGEEDAADSTVKRTSCGTGSNADLVDDSESEEDDLPSDGDGHASAQSNTRKRRREDASMPQWRRAFAHVDGNWPSHVKVDISVASEVVGLVKRVVGDAQSVVGDELVLVPMLKEEEDEQANDCSGLHLSLSRPFVLKFDQIDAFVETLRSALKWRTRFRVSLGRAIVLVNDDATRSFLVLQVDKGASQFVSLVKCVDKCMREFGLATYYEDPIPHVSIASALGDSLRGALPQAQLDHLLPAPHEDDETRAVVQVASVQVVIGNKHFRIPLR